MAALFSERFDQFLHNLMPRGPGGRLAFPAGQTKADMRIAGGETCRDMLLRCSTAIAGGDVLPFLIEDDLAVVAFIEFEKTTLRAASIQAIKTEGMDISTFLVDDADIVVHYFRFDAGQEAGPVFTHPYPHVHYSQAAGPRYSLNGWQSDNAIIEFFEHIYITCYHETWLDWARAVWRGHCNTTLRRDPERRFDEIVSAFRDSQYEAIKRLANDIGALKEALRDSKARYPLRIDHRLASLLAYPLGTSPKQKP